MSRWIITLFVAFFLNACAVVHENHSIAVDVYPVEYQLSMSLENGSEKQAERQWLELKHSASQTLLSQPVAFYYSSTSGKKLAKRWSSELLKQGAKDELISVVASKQLGEFDVQVQFINYKVVTPICEPQEVSEYAAQRVGCAPNSNLWQSMVAPQAALAGASVGQMPSGNTLQP
ncbi:hypothetical protein [Vibrio fluminensis]|uniref:hypothetical protein n=1 Tax=Vibrio fluminensis TaxID=2783614 RepID=UPI001888798B|nr:hypothetical protein [Vibrio fluminensis]